jgi:hypothetical protein
VIFADAVPAEATTPPTVIAAANSAAIALRRMLSPFMGWFSVAEFLLPSRREYFLALAVAVARSLACNSYTARTARIVTRNALQVYFARIVVAWLRHVRDS